MKQHGFRSLTIDSNLCAADLTSTCCTRSPYFKFQLHAQYQCLSSFTMVLFGRMKQCILLAVTLFALQLICAVAQSVPVSLTQSTSFHSHRISVMICSAVRRKHLTDKELQALDEDWMDEEEKAALPPLQGGVRQPQVPPGHSAKSEMAFATLTPSSSSSKADAESIASRWTKLIHTLGVVSRLYAIESHRLLIVCDERGVFDMNRVKAFLLQQSELQEFEWNQQKTKPSKTEAQRAQDNVDAMSKGATDDADSDPAFGGNSHDIAAQLMAAGLPPDLKLPNQPQQSQTPQHDET